VVSLPLIGFSGLASAKAARACHTTHSCKSGGGSPTGGGAGADAAPLTVQVDPSPLVETYQSFVVATVQVETSPSFAGDPVDISASQLYAVCRFGTAFDGFAITAGGPQMVTVTLDDDGNATVLLFGDDCAPGPSVVEADLAVAPYYTALTTLDALPPVVTAPGVTGYPKTSGKVSGGEVETADTGSLFDGSYVYGVFYVETNPVYAEQTVDINSPELEDRCGTFWLWQTFTAADSAEGAGDTTYTGNTDITGTLDDDGNAVFFFEGASCAAGPSVVTADVDAGSHPTYTTTFNVLAPQPTI
jgi:hypothetical protein